MRRVLVNFILCSAVGYCLAAGCTNVLHFGVQALPEDPHGDTVDTGTWGDSYDSGHAVADLSRQVKGCQARNGRAKESNALGPWWVGEENCVFEWR